MDDTQLKTIASGVMIGGVVGYAVGYSRAPRAFRGDDAMRYGLLFAVVGGVGASFLAPGTASAAETPSPVLPAVPAATPTPAASAPSGTTVTDDPDPNALVRD